MRRPKNDVISKFKYPTLGIHIDDVHKWSDVFSPKNDVISRYNYNGGDFHIKDVQKWRSVRTPNKYVTDSGFQ